MSILLASLIWLAIPPLRVRTSRACAAVYRYLCPFLGATYQSGKHSRFPGAMLQGLPSAKDSNCTSHVNFGRRKRSGFPSRLSFTVPGKGTRNWMLPSMNKAGDASPCEPARVLACWPPIISFATIVALTLNHVNTHGKLKRRHYIP